MSLHAHDWDYAALASKPIDWDYEREKQKNALLYQIKMTYNSLKSTEERMTNEKNSDGTPRFTEADIKNTLDRMNEGQESTYQQYFMMGGTEEELQKFLEDEAEKDKPKRKQLSITIDDVMKMQEQNEGSPIELELAKAQKKVEKKKSTKKVEKPTETKKQKEQKEEPQPERVIKFVDKVDFIPKEYKYDPTIEFDVIPLPSKGQCYSTKNNTIAVTPLNATDENILVSPNVYRQMKVVDLILKRKVLNGIDPNDLLDGDRDAIVLWLRATGYGNEYPVSVRDPETGQEFSSVVDLSEVNFKPFNLIGDENGWFDFTLPVSKDKVKFQFLSHREKEELSEIDKYQNTLTMKGEILQMSRVIDGFLNASEDLTDEVEEKLKTAEDNIIDAINEMYIDDSKLFTESLTNKLIYSIMSINGETDRDYIEKYISKMPARDAWALRTYITDNEPGVDFHFEVQKPESLGGGSMPVFLSINQFVFLNVSR